jgi:thiol:disulfide interchange protein/DsbC/DsbD-like thiol-disulfide interchange protein
MDRLPERPRAWRALRVAHRALASAWLGVLLAAGLAPTAHAQAAPGAAAAAARPGPQRVDAVEVELVADRAAVVPGGRVELGLRIRHEPHWHTYWRNPGDSGLATQLEPTGPEGTRFGALRWPAPQRLWVGPLANYGYEGEVVLPFSVDVPAGLAGPRARFEAAAQWLVCKDVCIPGEAKLAIELPVAAAGAEPARSAAAPLFAAAAGRIPDPSAPLAATAHREGGALSLAFATPPGATGVARAEFFPYDEGVVAAPAPQALSRTPSGWRLDLALADGAQPPSTLAGLLVVDERPIELQVALATGPAPAGTPVSVAAQPAGQSKAGGGLLGALSVGAGAGGAAQPGAASPARAAAAPVDASLALALLFGVIGGAILNLMPCVFPVVGLKVLGFAEAAADERGAARAMRTGAAAFAAGVLVSFWVLAGLMLALRAAGESVGWGFQLQSPAFVAGMALLFVAVGLNFSGVFEFGLAMTRLGGVASGASPWSAFGAGVLAVLVATPCTAPFMGSALGFTLSQPAAWTLAVFTAIGVGMALPYLLLGAFPAWVKRLPRPGRWMQTLRQVLAFPMYATAAWLAWVLVQQAGADSMLRLLLAAVVLGAAAWAWGLWANGAPRRAGLAIGALVAAAAAIGALLAPVLDAVPGASAAMPGTSASAPGSAASRASGERIAWEAWSDRRVDEALAEGRPVFVDFTAAWCVSCQANKKLVLDRDAVIEAMRARGVVALRADWTQRDPAITAALARHGRNGVPLYLVFRPGSPEPAVLPELLTVATVVDALR